MTDPAKTPEEQLEDARALVKSTNDAKRKAERAAAVEAEVDEFLAERAMFYVEGDGEYWEYSPDGGDWSHRPASHIRDYRVSSPDSRKALDRRLQEDKRSFKSRTFSFKDQPESVLNMMTFRRALWLEPTFEEPSKWFGYMLQSAGGSKKQNILHLQQVLGWKYLHPESFQLPCLCIYGKGGSGKNLLAVTITEKIFGSASVEVLPFKSVERFTAQIAGLTVAVFDETPAMDEYNQLKRLIGQPTITVEPKNLSIFKTDNTPLYWLLSNESTGPIRIRQDGSERRWSMIKCVESLAEVVAREEKLGAIDQELGDQCPIFQEATLLIKQANDEVFTNSVEVAKFLGQCVDEAAKLAIHPTALHGDDFREALEVNRETIEEVLHEVTINYKDFEYIPIRTLYRLYVARSTVENPAAAPMSQQKFTSRIGQILANQSIFRDIVRSDVRKIVRHGDEETKQYLVMRRDLKLTSNIVQDNHAMFEHGEHRERAAVKSIENPTTLSKLTTTLLSVQNT